MIRAILQHIGWRINCRRDAHAWTLDSTPAFCCRCHRFATNPEERTYP